MLGCATGMTQVEIARAVGISDSTLRAHYAEELADGGKKLLMGIAGNLARIAQDYNHPRAVTAAIFWLKTKGGFKEDGPPTGDDEKPQKVTFTINIGGSSPPKGPGDGAKVIDA